MSEQRLVLFYDDELTAIRAADGRVYVSLTQMCNALGLDAPSQRRRIRNHVVLADGAKLQRIDTPGGPQDAFMLQASLVPLWLSGLRASMVRAELQEKLKRFQTEAADVLWQAFQDGRLSTDNSFDEMLSKVSPETATAYQVAQAVLHLARQQVALEARLGTTLADHSQRLEALEATLGSPDRYVTPDQASQISQGVKTVAIALGKKSGRNEFGAVYGELYRKFGITSYKQLPATRFQEAMDWLNEWREHIEGDLPF